MSTFACKVRIFTVICSSKRRADVMALAVDEEQSCQIESRSDLKRGALGFFEDRRRIKNDKMSSDMGSVPGPKIITRVCRSIDRYACNAWTTGLRQVAITSGPPICHSILCPSILNHHYNLNTFARGGGGGGGSAVAWPGIERIDWTAREDGSPNREQCWPLFGRIDGRPFRSLCGLASTSAARSGCMVVSLNPSCIHRPVCMPHTLAARKLLLRMFFYRSRHRITRCNPSVCSSFRHAQVLP